MAVHLPSAALSVPQGDGFTYETLWRTVADSDADSVLIHSFKPWLEGTEIEPSEEHGWAYVELPRSHAEGTKVRRSRTVAHGRLTLRPLVPVRGP